MKKKIYALFLMLVLCALFVRPAYAESKPSVELSYLVFTTNSVNGCSPILYFRNNSTKAVKYYDWYVTLYNRVGDPTPDEITHQATIKLRVIGPSEPDTAITNDTSGMTRQATLPFPRKYKDTGYDIAYNGIRSVYLDEYGNYFIYDKSDVSGWDKWQEDTCIFLTEDEVQNRTFYQKVEFGVCWYSSTCTYVRLQKVVVTYMDGTTETISGSKAEYNRLNTALTNDYYLFDEARYSAVYDYKTYKALNPDLVATFGDNQYKYLRHFIDSGMKEGRQASASFNLNAYKANNPDLVAQFGADAQKYYEHYITSGHAEGHTST